MPFLTTSNGKGRKPCLPATNHKNWDQQHPELLRWTPNEQFESEMKLPLKRVSKITRAPPLLFPVVSEWRAASESENIF